jgi:predicted Zn finger-like uncharacterized protein
MQSAARPKSAVPRRSKTPYAEVVMPIQLNCPSCAAPFKVHDEHAGRRVKCPQCSAIVTVPADDGGIQLVPEGPRANVTAEEPARLRPESGRGRTRECPECGGQVSVTARTCRHCRARLDPDEAEDEEFRVRSPFVPCPRCHARGAKRVIFTFWGSFYGPALFSHVRCPECGYAYNGRTGGSNLVPAIFFVTIPLIGIIVIVGLLGLLIYTTFHR